MEWTTPGGYERCAGVVTARRAQAAVVWTAAHCVSTPLSIVRFFGGRSVAGSAVRVIARSASADAAALVVPRAGAVMPAILRRDAPPLGTILTIVGHPVSALHAPDAGRWTLTYARMGETVPNPQTGALEYEVQCGRCGPGDSGSGVFDDPAGSWVSSTA